MRSTAVHIGTFPSGSDEWHAAREDGIGGSEIAAVMGLSPWESRFSLWHRKKGLANTRSDSDEMRWGRYQEETIARYFTDQHPELRVRRTGTWRNKFRPWQIANPDRLITGPAGREVLEIKTARNGHGWGKTGSDDVPVYYRAQVLWYLDVLGLPRARVVVLIAGSDFREFVVESQPAEVEILRQAGAEFMRTLREDERPSIDEHGATYQVVRELHPDIDDVEVEIPGELAERYRAALADHEAAEATKRRAASEVLDTLGRARRAVHNGDPVALRVPGRGSAPPWLRACPVRTPQQKVSAA